MVNDKMSIDVTRVASATAGARIPADRPSVAALAPSTSVSPVQTGVVGVIPPTDPQAGLTASLAEAPPTEEAVQVVREFVSRRNELEFAIEEGSGRTLVTVRDPESGDVVRQIPSEELRAVAAQIRESLADSGFPGILFDVRS